MRDPRVLRHARLLALRCRRDSARRPCLKMTTRQRPRSRACKVRRARTRRTDPRADVQRHDYARALSGPSSRSGRCMDQERFGGSSAPLLRSCPIWLASASLTSHAGEERMAPTDPRSCQQTRARARGWCWRHCDASITVAMRASSADASWPGRRAGRCAGRRTGRHAGCGRGLWPGLVAGACGRGLWPGLTAASAWPS